jgi:hypothetical protein
MKNPKKKNKVSFSFQRFLSIMKKEFIQISRDKFVDLSSGDGDEVARVEASSQASERLQCRA